MEPALILILDCVSRVLAVEKREILSVNKARRVSDARAVAMYLTYKYIKINNRRITYQRIGEAFDRTKASVSNLMERVKSWDEQKRSGLLQSCENEFLRKLNSGLVRTELDAIRLGREMLPHLTDDQIKNILWTQTGFPGFVDIEDPDSHIISIFNSIREQDG